MEAVEHVIWCLSAREYIGLSVIGSLMLRDLSVNSPTTGWKSKEESRIVGAAVHKRRRPAVHLGNYATKRLIT